MVKTVGDGLAMFFGLFSLLFSVFSPTCIVFSVWQILCGFLVVTIESPCCCAFVEHVNKVTTIVDSKPLWMKAAAYVVVPFPAILFCFGANTFLGSGSIMATGVVYGMVALGKKASREEMTQNAQNVYQGPPKSPYEYQPQVNQNQPRPSKPTPPATSPTYNTDPIQAAASQWAAQSTTATFEPPPAYTASASNNIPTPTRGVGWDQTFLNEGNPAGVHSGMSANPTSSDPHNPFH